MATNTPAETVYYFSPRLIKFPPICVFMYLYLADRVQEQDHCMPYLVAAVAAAVGWSCRRSWSCCPRRRRRPLVIEKDTSEDVAAAATAVWALTAGRRRVVLEKKEKKKPG